MIKPRRNLHSTIALLLTAGALASGASSTYAGDEQPQIPTCDKKIGTLAVTEPQNQWWTQYNLESPAALIKVYVSESKCFTLVDRGKGLQAAQAERALAASGEERVGSNIGKGLSADPVRQPIVNKQRSGVGAR